MSHTPDFLTSPSLFRRRLRAVVEAHRRGLRWLLEGLAALLFIGGLVFLGLFLALRFVVLPHIQDYRADVARLLSDSLGLRVEISGIAADWRGLQPQLSLTGLRIFDKEGRPALAFDQVGAVMSWSSVPHATLVLADLEIASPDLAVRREADGRIFVAGIPLNTQAKGTDFSDWLLAQHRIVIRNARITWEDNQRKAPALALEKVNFRLENSGSRHRFGLTAVPPAALAAPLDIRGDLKGRNLDRIQTWRGEIFATTARADLAVWRQWLDYPADLPRGTGALRLWLTLEQGRLAAATADLGLADVALRLAPQLRELDLIRLSGRLSLSFNDKDFRATATHLTLETRDGLRLAPTNFSLDSQEKHAGLLRETPPHGSITANQLDLDTLRRLADFLPLDEGLRQRLAQYAPGGMLSNLTLNWQGSRNKVTGYSLKARFERLGMAAVGDLPGFSGLSGTIDGSDDEGSVTLDSRGAGLDLPHAFADPHLVLEHVKARLDWKKKGKPGEMEFVLKNLSFQNKDAEGFASGSYMVKPGTMGFIDLSAQLTQGDGKAVWRYMPLVVNQDTRDWLKQGILQGISRGTKLRLKGTLDDFPFLDGKPGIFRVDVPVSDAGLHYATGWPEIRHINGSLLFEGKRMVIRAESAKMYGVTLTNVVAELPDLLHTDEIMKISGTAQGPTRDFLQFIADSPVADRIDHFTDGMDAEGQGRLKLDLTLPLRHVDDSKVAGDFQFLGNRLMPDPDLPPLTDVNGHLLFTGDGVTVKRAEARILGGPLTLSAVTRRDGSVALNAQGSLSVAGMRKSLDWPALEHLSGTTNWHGTIAIRHRNADLILESNLTGIASSLPEPFNKSAASALPLRLERRQLPATDARKQDLLRFSLGRALNGQIRRSSDADGRAAHIDAGAIVLQSPSPSNRTAPALPPLPESGLALTARLDSLDLDFWRSLVPRSNGNGNDGGEQAGPALASMTLECDTLTAFGRSIPKLSVHARGQEGGWNARLDSPDIAGELSWNSRGKGLLKAHLSHLALAEAREGAVKAARDPLKTLPGLDVLVDDFHLHGMDLGKLELEAVNRRGTWQMRKVALTNPDARLSANGEWQTGLASTGGQAASSHSRLSFALETGNVGNLLERIGYPGAVKKGTAKLEGNLDWNAPPTSVDYRSLAGKLTVDAGKGQFAKLNPGVGRLLGVLSLQSLPRRITLDFNDIFSQGFAFDTIVGNLDVRSGVFSSHNLQIRGPAARILMSGSADLNNETQDLLVRVQPALSDSLAVGTMLINPAVGVATYLAQKLLKDPLGQAFEFDYKVTGPWSEPKVEKLAQRMKPPAPSPAQLPPQLPTQLPPPAPAQPSPQPPTAPSPEAPAAATQAGASTR